MTEQEQYHILMALQSLPKGGTENIKETLEKYRSFFQKSNQNYIQVDFSEWGKQKEILFDTLKKAIFDKKVISFVYYNSEGEKTERKAEPYQLWFKSRNWYLKAYCKEKNRTHIYTFAYIPCGSSFLLITAQPNKTFHPTAMRLCDLKRCNDYLFRSWPYFEKSADPIIIRFDRMLFL